MASNSPSQRLPFSILRSAAAAISLLLPQAAFADDAHDLLKAMSDYMASQKSFSFDYQSSLEAVTPDFQKLQFVSSGKATVERPDKLRISRTGGFADLDVSYDGKTLTIHGKNLDAYAKVEQPGSIDNLLDRMSDAGVEAPGADLLSSDILGLIMEDVTDVRHIGGAQVNGTPAEYIAFRAPEYDGQIWIADGPKPIPLRYVLTSKHVVQAPQYMLEISNFKTGSDVAAADFDIKLPEGAKKVDMSELQSLDELPMPQSGGQK